MGIGIEDDDDHASSFEIRCGIRVLATTTAHCRLYLHLAITFSPKSLLSDERSIAFLLAVD